MQNDYIADYCIGVFMYKDNLSALQVAVTEGNIEVAELLVDRGADMSVLDKVFAVTVTCAYESA